MSGYRISPSAQSFGVTKDPCPLFLEGEPKDSPRVDSNGTKVVLTKAQIDAELKKMRSMTAQEAAATADQDVAEAEAAIAEAEVAIAEAEEAAREAKDAERDAEAALAFAEAAVKALKCQNLRIW